MNVLVVDDSRAMRMIVTRTLRNTAGRTRAEIVEAANGAEFLVTEPFTARSFELVLARVA